MNRFLKFHLIAVGLLTVAGPAVYANVSAPITICGTGNTVGCTGLATPGDVDPNYSVVSSPYLSGAPAVVLLQGTFPVPPYSADGPSSQWIEMAPANVGGDASQLAGTYVYQTTFSLPVNFVSATVSGIWASDNQGLPGISLNGAAPLFPNSSDQSFLNYPTDAVAFTFTTGFTAGLNTLDFSVFNEPYNAANPEALRVDVSGTVTTPEPGLYAMLALGLGSLVFVVRRRAVKA